MRSARDPIRTSPDVQCMASKAICGHVPSCQISRQPRFLSAALWSDRFAVR